MITTQGSYKTKIPQYVGGNGLPMDVPYLLHLPKTYDSTKKYPLIISLSGNGEVLWNGIQALRNSGINNAIINKGLEIPFVVIAPQTGGASYDVLGDSNTYLPGQFASETLDNAKLLASIDTNKVFLVGLSMGSEGVYNALVTYPDKFCGGVAIAGWCTDMSKAKLVKGVIWDAKYENDNTAGSAVYNASFIDACVNSKKAQYTYIPGSSHGLWDELFQDTWESMTPSTNFPKSVKPSNIYTWMNQFSLDGATTTPVTPTQPTTSTININNVITPATVAAQTITILNSTGAKINVNGIDYNGNVTINIK